MTSWAKVNDFFRHQGSACNKIYDDCVIQLQVSLICVLSTTTSTSEKTLIFSRGGQGQPENLFRWWFSESINNTRRDMQDFQTDKVCAKLNYLKTKNSLNEWLAYFDIMEIIYSSIQKASWSWQRYYEQLMGSVAIVNLLWCCHITTSTPFLYHILCTGLIFLFILSWPKCVGLNLCVCVFNLQFFLILLMFGQILLGPIFEETQSNRSLRMITRHQKFSQ